MPKHSHSEQDIAEEEKAFAKVIATFEQYETYAVSPRKLSLPETSTDGSDEGSSRRTIGGERICTLFHLMTKSF